MGWESKISQPYFLSDTTTFQHYLMKERIILGSIYWLLVLFWGTLALILFLTAMPYSSLEMDKTTKLRFQRILPEGWSFFTKSPRDPYVFILTVKDDKLAAYSNLPNSNPQNLFGAKRNGRAIGVEFGLLTQDLSEQDWLECDPKEILALAQSDTVPSITVKNPYKRPLLTGEVVVVTQEPIPWAWSASHEKATNTPTKLAMPTKLLKLNIK